MDIRHETRGTYVTRTIIEWDGFVTEGDAIERLSLAEPALNGNGDGDGETLDDLKHTIESRDREIKWLEDDLEDRDEKIERLETEASEYLERLAEDDPGQAMRDEISDLRAEVERLKGSLAARASQAHADATTIHQLRYDVAQLKRGIMPPRKKPTRAVCACGGHFLRRSHFRPVSVCVRCGTPKGETPSAETLAQVAEINAA